MDAVHGPENSTRVHNATVQKPYFALRHVVDGVRFTVASHLGRQHGKMDTREAGWVFKVVPMRDDDGARSCSERPHRAE